MNPNPFISADQEPAPAQSDSLADNSASAAMPEVQSQPATEPVAESQPVTTLAAQPTTQFQPAAAPISDDELTAANQNIGSKKERIFFSFLVLMLFSSLSITSVPGFNLVLNIAMPTANISEIIALQKAFFLINISSPLSTRSICRSAFAVP